MKKLLTLLLSAITVTTIFAGCQSTGATPSASAKASASPTATTVAAASATASAQASASAAATPTPVPTLTPDQIDKHFPLIKDKSEFPQLTPIAVGDPIAIFHTSMGDIKVRLFPKQAPLSVANFEALAQKSYYDNTIFHRVINEFMIQGGDPNGTGTGGKTATGQPLPDEISPYLKNFNGALAYANSGPGTNASQFFIVENNKLSDPIKAELDKFKADPSTVIGKDAATQTDIQANRVYSEPVITQYETVGGYPTLDFNYTVFGQVYEGMDIVTKIAESKTYTAADTKADPKKLTDKPVADITLKSVEIGKYAK